MTRVHELLVDAELRRESGREVVREHFLLTRLVADELRLYASLVDRTVGRGPTGTASLDRQVREPVCGVHLDGAETPRHVHEGRV